MEDGEHRVGLPPPERSLKLDHGLAAFAVEALRDLRQEEPHPFGDERPLVESRSVLVLARRLAVTNGSDVRRELRLLKGALQDVRMGHADLTPRLHDLPPPKSLSCSFVSGNSLDADSIAVHVVTSSLYPRASSAQPRRSQSV